MFFLIYPDKSATTNSYCSDLPNRSAKCRALSDKDVMEPRHDLSILTADELEIDYALCPTHVPWQGTICHEHIAPLTADRLFPG